MHFSAVIRGGSINIDAANDFVNLGAKIDAAKNTLTDATVSSGSVAISAGDDVNIETLKLRNRSEITWGSSSDGGTIIKDNIALPINSLKIKEINI